MEFNPNLAQVQLTSEQVEKLLKNDEEFFIQFFLYEELEVDGVPSPVPDFHVDVFHNMTSLIVDRFAVAIPRDHAKTTLAKLAAVWYFLFSKYSFIVYLSNTATVAQAACLDIIGFLESDNCLRQFGPLEWQIKREGEGFYKFKFRGKVCILRALGAGQQVRGLNIENRRPQLAIVDDLEDTDNIATEELFRKLKKWFYGTFRKALDKFDHKIIHLGNMISAKCLLKEHCESRFWHSIRYGCLLSDGSILWERAWPIEKLRQDFAEYLENGMIDVWFAEMMNLPIASGMGLIKAEEIRYAPTVDPADIDFGFITVDPSISQQAWAHKGAVVVHAFVNERWQIVDYKARVGMDPLELFETIVDFAMTWNVGVIGIENVAYQASLQYVFPYIALTRGIQGLKFVPLHSAGVRKVQRISGWCSLMKKGEYYINEGDFFITEELLMFDPVKKENEDNIIDSCAYGPQMIENYLAEIMEVFNPLPEGALQTSYQVAEI